MPGELHAEDPDEAAQRRASVRALSKQEGEGKRWG